MRDKIKKKRSEDAKKHAKNNWWVQKLIRVHRDAKRNGTPIGFARLIKPRTHYKGGTTQAETDLEWAMRGHRHRVSGKKGGPRHMYLE